MEENKEITNPNIEEKKTINSVNNSNIEENKDINNPKTAMMYRVIAIVVALLIILFLWLFFSQNARMREAEAMNLELQAANEQLVLENEQIQLNNEFQALDDQFQAIENQSLKIVINDSITEEYNKAKERIEELRKELKDEKNKNKKRIKELQSEIETLKGILRHYVAQIDSLSKENAGLKAENAEIKSKNTKLTTEMGEVSQQKKVLEERMVLAEKLNVTGLTFTPLKKNGKKEKKIAKAKQLMVTFTIPQNNSTPVGVKNLYLRITSPEGNLLGNAGTFSFEGANVACTARKQIEYGGEEISGVTIYWDVNTALNPGEYLVELFTDGYRLVSRRFNVEK